jgi:tetratricopeptide (TPR) repeat protein
MLKPLIILALAAMAGTPLRAAEGPRDAGRAAYTHEDFVSSERHFREALAGMDARGERGPALAGVLNDLGMSVLQQGRLAEADPLLRRALSISEGTAPGLELATVIENVAELRRRQGRPADAQSLLGRAMALRESVAGPQDPGLPALALRLGTLREVAGDVAGAERLYTDAAERAERVGVREVHGVALNNLATLALERGDRAAAERLLRRAVASAEEPPVDERGLATFLANLGSVGAAHDRWAAATAHHARAVALLERDRGAGPATLPGELNALAAVAARQGDARRAVALYRRSLAILEAEGSGPEGAVDRARALNNLGVRAAADGRDADARHLYMRSLAALETLDPAAPKDVAHVLLNLAVLSDRGHRRAEARAFRDRAEELTGDRAATRAAAAW